MKFSSIIAALSLVCFSAYAQATPPDKLPLCEKDRASTFIEKTLEPLLDKGDLENAVIVLEKELASCIYEDKLEREALVVSLAMGYLKLGKTENCKKVARTMTKREQLMDYKPKSEDEWESLAILIFMSKEITQACPTK